MGSNSIEIHPLLNNEHQVHKDVRINMPSRLTRSMQTLLSISNTNSKLKSKTKHRLAFEDAAEKLDDLVDEEWEIGDNLDVNGFKKEQVLIFPLHCATLGLSVKATQHLMKDEKVLYDITERCHIKPAHVAALFSEWQTRHGIDYRHNTLDQLLDSLNVNNDNKFEIDRNNFIGTPLHFACLKNNYRFVEKIIQRNAANLNDSNEKTMYTPLHLACESNSQKIVKLLIDNKADLFAADCEGNNMLHYAIRHDNPGLLTQIFDYTELATIDGETIEKNIVCLLNNENNYHRTPLQLAVEHGCAKAVEYLLRKLKTCPNWEKNHRLIHLAARKGFTEIIKLLHQYGYDFDTRDAYGRTAFHITALYNQVETIEALLALENVDKEVNDDIGYTPLMCAVIKDNLQAFRTLWSRCLRTKVSFIGDSVFMVAVKHNSTKCLDFLMEEIEKDATENIKQILLLSNIRLNTPLHAVAESGNIDIFKSIIQYYKDVNMRNIDIHTPLHIAALNGHASLVKSLLTISTYSVQDSYKTIKILLKCKNEIPNLSAMLDNAIRNEKIASVKALLDYTTVKQIKLNDGYPLHEAVEKQLILVIKMLLDLNIVEIDKRKPIDEWELTGLELAIKNKYEEGVQIILQKLYHSSRELWFKMLRLREYHVRNNQDSPIQLIIKFMPSVLNEIFEKCKIKKKNSIDYNYQLIDDIYYLQELDANDLGTTSPYMEEKEDTGKLYPQAQQRLTNFDDIIKNHPLKLMLLRSYMTIRLNIDKLIEISLWIPLLILFIDNLTYCDQATQRTCLICFNIIAWINLFKYIRKFPRFGIYVLIVMNTIWTFLRMLPLFILFLISFSMNFYILLHIPEISESVMKRILHTIVFLTAEFDYADTIGTSEFTITYFVFFLYLFIGTIFLMNLLVGLAVSDTADAIEEASKTRIKLEIDIILHVESCLPESIRRRLARGNEKVKTCSNEHFHTTLCLRQGCCGWNCLCSSKNIRTFIYHKWILFLKNFFGLPKDCLKRQDDKNNLVKDDDNRLKGHEQLEDKLDTILEKINKLEHKLQSLANKF